MTIPPSDLVLIDTCIWVGFFNRNQSAERITVDPLLDDDRAAITGMILAEILQGFRRDEPPGADPHAVVVWGGCPETGRLSRFLASVAVVSRQQIGREQQDTLCFFPTLF